MTEHEHLQEEIQAYVAARLEGEALRRMEQHLRACPECREMASTWKQVVAALRQGGEALFHPHPDEMAVRRHALGEEAPGDGSVAEHIATCPSCALEVEAWRMRDDRPALRAAESRRRRPAGRGPSPVLAAASILVAFILGALVSRPLSRAVRMFGGDVPGSRELQPPAGPAAQLILPGTARGGDGSLTFKGARDEPYVVVSLRTGVPESAASDDRCRIDVRRDDGTVIVSSRVAAGRMREQVEASDVVTIVIPAALLSPGRYEFMIFFPDEEGSRPFYRARVTVLPPDPVP